jgi:lipopolysaccharide assembly outer membrane protein LptD (OstA)
MTPTAVITPAAASIAPAAGATVSQTPKMPVIDAKINTASPLYISADNLDYSNANSIIIGKGHVIARNDDTTIFCDNINYNADTGDLTAQGRVLAIQNGSSIYTEKLYMNTKTEDAYAKDVDVTAFPWIVKGKQMKKTGKKSEIENPVFTTCDARDPHYRMEASNIYIYEDEKIESWNTVLYLGDVPVFYFPYFSQPLKQEKRPYDIQFGHNTYAGYYVDTTYTINFNPLNTWTAGYDFMQLAGSEYLLNGSYGFNQDSNGTFAGTFTNDIIEKRNRWTVDFSHNQQFNSTTRLGLLAQSVSDAGITTDYLNSQGADMFRQNYQANFATSFGNQTFAFTASDAEELTNTAYSSTTDTAAPTPVPVYSYYTAQRILPSLSYNMTSTQILPRLYYSHSVNLTRNYAVGLGNYYTDTGTFAPQLAFSAPYMYILSLSANAGLSSQWLNSNDSLAKGFFNGNLTNSITSNESASLDIIPGGFLRAQITHSYAKMLNNLNGAEHAGITTNMLSGVVTGGFGPINLNVSSTYNLLTDTAKTGFDVDRMSMLNFNLYSSARDIYFSSSGIYSPYVNSIKSLNLNFDVKDMGPKALWDIGVYTNYVNNALDPTGFGAVTRTPDVLTFGTSMTFDLTPEFRFTVAREYDLIAKVLNSHVYTVTWHLHCWDVSGSWSKRQDNAEEIYFTINISAIPQARFNKPSSSTVDDSMTQIMNMN